MEVAAQKFENIHAFREKKGFHFIVMLILPGDIVLEFVGLIKATAFDGVRHVLVCSKGFSEFTC